MAINYNAMITKYSWWKNITGSGTRYFSVVERLGEPDGKDKIKIHTVMLLEFGKTEPKIVSWKDMIGWIDAGVMELVR